MVILCQEMFANKHDFVMCSDLLRRLLPVLVLAIAVIVFVWSFTVSIKLNRVMTRSDLNRSDALLVVLLSSGIITSLLFVFSSLGSWTNLDSNASNRCGNSTIYPRLFVSLFVSYRLAGLVILLFVLANCFRSARHPARSQYALSQVTLFRGKCTGCSKKERILLAMGYTMSFIALIAFALTGAVLDDQHYCQFIITEWQRYVVMSLSYILICIGAILLLFICKARITPSGRVLSFRRRGKWIDTNCHLIQPDTQGIDWFNSEWPLTRMFLVPIITSYVTWIPFLILLTMYDDHSAATHESIEIIAIFIAFVGFLAEPFLYAAAPRYALLYKEVFCSVKDCCVLTFGSSEYLSTRTSLLASGTLSESYEAAAQQDDANARHTIRASTTSEQPCRAKLSEDFNGATERDSVASQKRCQDLGDITQSSEDITSVTKDKDGLTTAKGARSKEVLGLAKEQDGLCIVNEADQRVKGEKEKEIAFVSTGSIASGCKKDCVETMDKTSEFPGRRQEGSADVIYVDVHEDRMVGADERI